VGSTRDPRGVRTAGGRVTEPARGAFPDPRSTRNHDLGIRRARSLSGKFPSSPAGAVERLASWPQDGLVSVASKRPSGYTFGMKTAISLPDDVFQQAERLARRLKKSRSELYREAVAEYVARHEPEAITDAMNRVAGEVDTGLDAFSSAAARKVLERMEW